MADTTALKNRISAAIKANDNKEITGPVLQQSLLDIVDELNNGTEAEASTRSNADATLQQNITAEKNRAEGAESTLQQNITAEKNRAEGAESTLQQNINAEAMLRQEGDTQLNNLITDIKNNIDNGFVYAGIATPTTTPATGKVFYIALTAGTYTNFGNTDVSQGINILKYDGSDWSLDVVIALDNAPTPSSNNLVKSGGVFDKVMTDGSAFDISAHFASGGTLATYADLSAVLTALDTLSASYKKGGMSIKFIQSSDNKYVQYRLMSDTFNTTPADWQGVDDEPTSGSENLVKSGGVADELTQVRSDLSASIQYVYKKSNYNDGDNIIDFNTIHLITDNPEFICVAIDTDDKILYGIKADGQPYFGVGCPQQVKDYVNEQINKILGTDDITTTIDSLKEIESFLKDFTNSDTLKKLLDLKANVDEVKATTDDIYKKSNPNDSEGNVVDTNTIVSVEDNPEYIKALTDSIGKLIEAIGLDGVRKFFAGINIQGVGQYVIDNPEYIVAWLDSQDRIIFAIENDGNPYFGYGVPRQIKGFAEDLNIAISSKIDEIMQALENAKIDVDKKIHFGDNIYPADVHKISDNPEYISVILDAAQKILEAYGVDGIKRLFTAIELMGTKMSVEDNSEFIKVDVDKGNKILGGFKVDGDYVFGAGVPIQIQVKAKEIASNLDTANAIELDSDIDGSIYASMGKDGNIDITSDDEGAIYMIYDTDKIDIKDAYEDMNGNLIVEQNKVMLL